MFNSVMPILPRGGIKRLLNLFAAAVLLVPAGVFAADSPLLKAPKQKGFPDELMGWMSERYGAKTMLGLKWENPEKAKQQYVVENNAAAAFSLLGPGVKKSGFRAGSAKRKGPAGRLDIMPTASFFDMDTVEAPVTNSYIEFKYTRLGAGASWNSGYIKYSETRYGLCTTEASVIFASLVLTLPMESFSMYAFGGPAIVSYDYTDPTIIATGTTAALIAGVGYALRLSASGFGVFAEYKHIQESSYYPGMDSAGLGFSLGF